jgi:hypothetical protein
LLWCRRNKIRIVMHGHKHIPRPPTPGDVPILGCGSSVGAVESDQFDTVLSINLVTIDENSQSASCRLIVEYKIGHGEEDFCNEVHLRL